MSRRPPAQHHRRHPSTSDNNPYQGTTVATCNHQTLPTKCPIRSRNIVRNGPYATTVDTCLSDDTDSYYEYYQDRGYHPQDHNRYLSDHTFSDDSGSIRIPHYENEDLESFRRHSRNASERSYRREKVNPLVHKDVRRIYPNHAGPYDGTRVYQEIQSQAGCDNAVAGTMPRRMVPVSRLSDRPQSAMSSGVTSAIVDGCGGKCQTFENVCYFFLQLVFMMGILVGVSLCIAGLVLRKSAAKNLQVLVYIGVLLAVVSALLLGIQWSARSNAKKRKQAVRMAKRAPIPLETLHPRVQQPQQQPLMMVQEGQRVVPQIMRPLPTQPDEQGIPWWRRKDLV